MAGVAELGIKICSVIGFRPSELPDDLLAAAMTLIDPVVRGIGIRLYGELPDAVLAERFRVLVHLVTNPWADVPERGDADRRPARPETGRSRRCCCAPSSRSWRPRAAEDVHRDLVRLLRTDLAGTLPLVEPGQVFRLLRSP